MRTAKNVFSIILLLVFLINPVFCASNEEVKFEELATYANTDHLTDYFYDAAHEELYIVELEDDTRTSHGYVIRLDGSPVENPTYPFSNLRRRFMAFDGTDAAAIEDGIKDDGTYATYINDFSGDLIELPKTLRIYSFKIRNGRFGFIGLDNDGKRQLYDLSKQELLKGDFHPVPLTENLYFGFDYSLDGTKIYINTSDSNWPFLDITEFDARTYQPIQSFTLTSEHLACIHDLICTEDSFITQAVFTAFGAYKIYHQYSSNWELIGVSTYAGHKTPLTIGPKNSTIVMNNYDDEYNELPYHKISKIIWSTLESDDKDHSGSSRIQPLIIESNFGNLTKARYINRGFGLFHPLQNDPENENKRDKSIVLAPLRSAGTQLKLDIPYYDLQNTFGSEAKTLLLEWNDQTLSIPLETLDCSETISRITCNAEMTLRLHLSMKEDQIHLNSKELLTTESVDTCTTCIHHIQLP